MAGPLVGILPSIPFFLQTGEEQIRYLTFIATHHNYPEYDWMIWSLGLLYNWAVLLASLTKIRRYRHALEEELSDIQGVSRHVLRRQLLLYFLCWIAVTLVSTFSYSRYAVEVSLRLSALLPALYLLVSAYTFLFRLVESRPRQEEPNPLKGRVDKEQLDKEYQIIQQEMKEKQHFLDPELSLPQLAEKSSFYRNELSGIINQGSGESFYHFVNRYRIEHVKKLLKDNRDKTILELAFRSGFNSKGAFYNAFKRITGITPREYLKSSSGNR